jgi:hypothetical protein
VNSRQRLGRPELTADAATRLAVQLVRRLLVIPKSDLTPSEKVWELLIPPCENFHGESNGRRLRLQTWKAPMTAIPAEVVAAHSGRFFHKLKSAIQSGDGEPRALHATALATQANIPALPGTK